RKTIREIGYNHKDLMFDTESCEITLRLHSQSPDISQGVTATEEKEQGAGDQGLMFGFATNETKELMPMPILLSQKLAQELAKIRKNNVLPWIRPDGKTQVSVRYENNKPTKIETVVISTQHSPEVSQEEITKEMIDKVIKPVLGNLWNDDIKIHINPTGKFVIGGPHGDAGLTGRKIIVDTYGGWAPHGGGAFSGKDPSKVDRSATYAARHIAKNVVAAKLAKECLVQLSYAIGVAEPISVFIDTKGTGVIPDTEISKMISKEVDLTPKGIIKRLNLRKPIYQKTAAYGHFGREEETFTWEQLSLLTTFKKYA
ncbi:MAG: methionine adenosyltransferase, partial [Candidatus Bathyarchaeota archaeon]